MAGGKEQQSNVATRQWLQKQFQSSGIQIDSSSLKQLAKTIEATTNPEDLLAALLDEIETNTDDRKLRLEFLNDFLERAKGSTFGETEVLQAFDTPMYQYDSVRKMFHKCTERRKVIANAESKIQLYVDRYLLVQQRLRRNALFRPMRWGSLGSRRDVAELTELKALLGLQGERKFVCGFLTKHEEGQYYIEDLSARLPIDLSVCDTADGLFTENCIVVAEGELLPGGEFRAAALGLPPAEPRQDSINALQGLDLFMGRSAAEQQRVQESDGTDDGDRVVFLSDVHLDNPQVLDYLKVIFDGFSSMDEPPSVFVLFGSFQSFNANHPGVSLKEIKQNFSTLGRLIAQYPNIKSKSQIILVPGPNDIGPANMLPRSALPNSIAEGLVELVPNVTLASNPCRLRHRGCDLILFRANLHHLLQGLCILPPPIVEDSEDTNAHASFYFDQVASSVIQESHLCPVPLEYQPIAWEWDHSLWVYPNPHGLVLADSEPAARSIFDTCDCLNPGSLSRGTFGAWSPSLREMELCDVAGQEVEEEDDIEASDQEIEDQGEPPETATENQDV